MSRTTAFVATGLAVALLVGVVVSTLASPDPDGLESAVIESVCDGDEACLEEAAGDPVYDAAPLPDYERTPLSGLLGTVAVFVIGAGLVALARVGRRRSVDRDA